MNGSSRRSGGGGRGRKRKGDKKEVGKKIKSFSWSFESALVVVMVVGMQSSLVFVNHHHREKGCRKMNGQNEMANQSGRSVSHIGHTQSITGLSPLTVYALIRKEFAEVKLVRRPENLVRKIGWLN